MSTPWETLIEEALAPPPEDADLRILRERLAQGWCVVEVALLGESSGRTYRVTLEYDHVLHHLSVAHSLSFTRWTLTTGTRMVDQDNEASRWAAVLTDRLDLCCTQLDDNALQTYLVEYLQALRVPIAGNDDAADPQADVGGQARIQFVQAVEQVLKQALREIVEDLGYERNEAARILALALQRFAEPILRLKTPQ